MAPNSLESRATDVRGTPRSSIYLAANLYFGGSPSCVKIRNISATGALIDGVAIPKPGSLVQLVRGGLIVHALVAWTKGNRCGLKFSHTVDVQRWRAAPTHAEQQRVDEVVRLVKAGVVPLPIPPLPGDPGRAELDAPTHDVARDLRQVSGLLEKLGSTLAADPQVLERHGAALQNLDIAMQLLAALDGAVTDGEIHDGDLAKLAGLRRSADQALQQSS